MRVLVLGGYGLIGTDVVRSLVDAGCVVTGLGRNTTVAKRRFPDVAWIEADLRRLDAPAAWRPILAECAPEAIVNCVGALQDGLRDDVQAVQAAALKALYLAADAFGTANFVQISAPRAATSAETAFMRSKGEADEALMASPLQWTVLRPGLVIGPQAYGGTALVRSLASVPLVQPMAHGDARIQTVAVDEVAFAVRDVLTGKVPPGRVYDLVEDQERTLEEVVRQFRGWLGVQPAPVVRVPRPLVNLFGRLADGLGWLGWRSPLRTTALNELAGGVVGDPAPWRAASGRSCASLEMILRRLQPTVQERWFARAFLLKPVMIAVLSAFWLASGIVALLDIPRAAAVLTDRGGEAGLAQLLVIGGAAIDVLIGLAVLFRATMPLAAKGMIAVTSAYLVGGTLLAPDLWLDPLGPLVKTLPAMLPALVLLAFADDR